MHENRHSLSLSDIVDDLSTSTTRPTQGAKSAGEATSGQRMTRLARKTHGLKLLGIDR